MNVLILSLGKDYGGAEKVIENIKEYSKNQIFLGIINDTKFYEKNKNDNKCVFLDSSKKEVFKNIKTLINFVKNKKIEIIHCHGVFAEIIGTVVSIITKVKVITTIHSRADFDTNNFVKGKAYILIQKSLLLLNDKYIVVSKELDEIFKSKKTQIIHNGIPSLNNSKKITRKVENELKIISIGRLTTVKGHSNLIEGLKSVQDKGYKFSCKIIGDGELKDELNNKIFQYGMEKNIELVGFVADISPYLLDTDCLIMTSYMEGIPITILEAMSSKIPVITNKVGGITNIFNEGDFVELKSNHPDDISKGIISFIEKKENEIKQIVTNAYNNFKKSYSIESFIQNQDSVYDQCMVEEK